jgi:transaldolase
MAETTELKERPRRMVMKPQGLKTRIFLDGGNPEETKRLKETLGFLDGQTTNPTYVSKNPEAKARLASGEKFTGPELLDFYQSMVREISGLIPSGSVSIEVYADETTTAEQMLEQGREMFAWIPNAHVKLPCSAEGLEAASQAVREGMRVNMTLCFSQQQAAAVYAATRGAARGDVFVSPFVGRLDDRSENGMSLIENILRMYGKGDGHVQVLSASLRHQDHLLESLRLGADILTAGFETLQEWARAGMPLPEGEYRYNPAGLARLPFEDLDLSRDWQSFDIAHPKTSEGMAKFSADWNGLLRETQPA